MTKKPLTLFVLALFNFFTMSLSNASTLTIQTQLLRAARIDLPTDTITVPLHHGKLKDGRSVWYVLLDSSDQAVAQAQGLVYAPALANATQFGAVREAIRDSSGELVFDHGAVDFSPVRSLVPGQAPNLFPPQSASPGSVGDTAYSPYAQVAGESGIYNAPVIAFNIDPSEISFCGLKAKVNHAVVHDKVVSICPERGYVTLALSHGFANNHPLVYVSLDSNNPLAATMEGATYAPALSVLNNTNATLPLFAVTNGEIGKNNPKRQGFDSALSGDGSPLNVLIGIPTLSNVPYSPLWELHIAQWTPDAISSGARVLLSAASQFQSAAQAGVLTGLGGGPLNSSGITVNCPAVAILK